MALPHVELQRDFVRFCGGDPARYSGITPPHLFSQWALPVALTLARQFPYPPLAVVNLGCSLSLEGMLPDRGHVDVQCTLADLSEADDKVRLTLRILTLFERDVRLRAELRLLVRLPAAKQAPVRERDKRERHPSLVPGDARELARRRLSADAGLEFAQLTGDFNPIHWVAGYARMVGFKAPIIHGFGSLAIAFEALVQGRLCGRVADVRRVDAEFNAPLVLPREVGVFLHDGTLFVADAPLGPAYMTARVETS